MGGKRLTYMFVKYQFEEDNYNLLSSEYINCSTKLRYKCSKGHVHSISWDSWKQGHRCPFCAGQGKLTTEYVSKTFIKEGYTLLSKEYVNSDSHLEYVCPEGHKHSMKWNNWRIGRRCPSCKAANHSKRTSGSGHYNWKGGITKFNKELRNFIKFIKWGDRIFKRDNYICKVCENRGGSLVAHHIMPLQYIKEYFDINNMSAAKKCDILYDINNGLTLCEGCHKECHDKFIGGIRESWVNVLLEQSNGLYKPFVMATLRRNSSNCWKPLTSSVEGNQQRSLEKERSETSEMRRALVSSKRGGS